MLNMDAETSKSKRKNDEPLATRRKRWRMLLIVINGLMLLLLFAIYKSREVILSGSTPPTIDVVEYRIEPLDYGEKIYLTIHFHDAEGDVNTFSMEVGGGRENASLIGSRDVTNRPSEQRRGATITTWLTCDDPYGIRVTLTFTDQLGNESTPYRDNVNCFTFKTPPILLTQQVHGG